MSSVATPSLALKRIFINVGRRNPRNKNDENWYVITIVHTGAKIQYLSLNDKNVILCHFIAIFCAKIQMFYFLKDSFLTRKIINRKSNFRTKIGILPQCVVSLFYYHEPHFSVVTYEKSLYKSCESKTQANKIKQMCQYNKVENVLQ